MAYNSFQYEVFSQKTRLPAFGGNRTNFVVGRTVNLACYLRIISTAVILATYFYTVLKRLKEVHLFCQSVIPMDL